MEQIDSGQIHSWVAYLQEITDPRLLDEYKRLLSAAGLRQQMRSHFERDRHRYLVTRAMLRMVLSKYACVAPRDWRFGVNPYGRPSIAPELASASRLEFNVSHTDGLVVLGVTCERAIGVDVENMRAREVEIGIADRYFALEEVAALHALPRERQRLRFFQYWTLKESYIKARGMGLSIPLDKFVFHLDDPPRIRLTLDPSLNDWPEHWAFWQMSLGHDQLAAVCAEDGEAESPCLAPTRNWP